MQTVLAIAAKAVTAVKAGATAAKGAAVAAKAAGTGSKILQAIRVGTSVVSGISTFARASAEARALEQNAKDAGLEATQEFVQAQQRNNAIQAQYNATVGDQMAYASAAGIDLSSGSVVEARRAAQFDAQREIDITRQGAEMNAALRRGRAASLRAQASLTKTGGGMAGLVSVGNGLVEAGKVR